MILRSAALLRQVCIEALGPRVATRVPRRVSLKVETDLARMVAAVIDLRSKELLVAMGASELLEAGEHLPKYVLPRDLLLPQEHHKLVDVPVLVALVLRDRVAVVVDEEVRLWALDPLPLVARVQRPTVDAPLQHIVLFLKEVLELLHEQLALQLVLLVVQLVEVPEGDLAREPLLQCPIHAVHINW